MAAPSASCLLRSWAWLAGARWRPESRTALGARRRRPGAKGKRPALVTPCIALTIAVSLPACSGGDGDSYRLTAYFESAVALYPHGDVVVMGIDVGTVEEVEIEDTQVRVVLAIREDVPLADDVRATIEPLTLIGERNVHLFRVDERGNAGPAWTRALEEADAARMGDGDEIPRERTSVPVEPDEGLQAFNDLAESLEPDVVEQLITDSADALDGQGQNIATAIDQAASLSTLFATLDTQLVAVAEDLDALASTLNTRDAQLRTLVTSFSDATGVLAAERDAITTFLGSLVQLTAEGERILDLHAEQLPADIANLTALLMVLDENDEAINQLFGAFPLITQTIAEAYQPEIDGFNLVASPTPSFVAIYDNFLENLGLVLE